ncbi:MAG: hypothetical protein KF886_24725 [Candidatus Hydrogenedentes bacterium]|nr:hypothetical protein [Candidatus Hydrogenedentota bacterium]
MYLQARSFLLLLTATTVVGTSLVRAQEHESDRVVVREVGVTDYDAEQMALEGEGPRYVALNQERLFGKLGFSYDKRVVEARGVSYIAHGTPKSYYNVSLAVHTSLDAARRSLRKVARTFPLGAEIKSGGVGSEYAIISGDDGGTVLLREYNITIYFSYKGDSALLEQVADTVAGIIRNDRAVAEVGVMDEDVRVQSYTIHEADGQEGAGIYMLKPILRGFESSRGLAFGAGQAGNTISSRGYQLTHEREEGVDEILIDLRGNEKPDSLSLYIANEDNIYITEKVQVASTP